MKKKFTPIAILILILALFLCACETKPDSKNGDTITPTEEIVETTEAEVELDSDWLSDAAIDEAYACLFPSEGEINIEKAQEILLPLVEAGNAEAQYYWGYIYDWLIVDNNGEGEKESLHWYKLAADQGFPKAYLAASLNTYIESDERANELVELAKQAGLFEMTPEVLGADGCAFIGAYYAVNKDYITAFEWNSKASELGSTFAMRDIGLMYYNGVSVEKDIDVAMEWFLKAANLGNVYAMNWYGYIFCENNYESELLNKKYAAALDRYRQAAEAGDPVAMHNIGQMYAHGLGGLHMDFKTATDWFLKSAELGDAASMYEIGRQYHDARDFEAAKEWYQKAADLEYADAMNALGYIESDSKKAQEWYEKAYDAHLNQAGRDNDQHIDPALDELELREVPIEMFRKAVDAGYAYAMNNIGFYVYEEGYGGLRSEADARACYKIAIEAGNPTAMANLGFSYYRSGDYDSAMEWLIKAYVNGKDNVADTINNMLTKKQGVNAYFEHYGELISTNP